jgi:voltage-gated potassium channel
VTLGTPRSDETREASRFAVTDEGEAAESVGSDRPRRPIRSRSSAEREALAERIADRLDVPITAAGVIFLLLVLAETISNPKGSVGTFFAITSWVLWALFVAEFLLRLYIAPSTTKFLKRNWWQLIFLAVPALRFVRALRALRAARVGRVLSSAVRSSRTAGRTLSSRLGALGVVTIVVILASSQLLFELGDYDSYGDALDDAALATVAGEPFFPEHAALRVVQIVVISYSVVVFAALAGTVGAFLLERRDDDERRLRSRQRDEGPTV